MQMGLTTIGTSRWNASEIPSAPQSTSLRVGFLLLCRAAISMLRGQNHQPLLRRALRGCHWRECLSTPR